MNHDGHLNHHMSKEEDNKIVAPRQKTVRNKTMLHEQNKCICIVQSTNEMNQNLNYFSCTKWNPPSRKKIRLRSPLPYNNVA